MERLEQFEPLVVHAASHDAQSYALAYVEHYQGNVPQMEREREFLLERGRPMAKSLPRLARMVLYASGRYPLNIHEPINRLAPCGIALPA